MAAASDSSRQAWEPLARSLLDPAPPQASLDRPHHGPAKRLILAAVSVAAAMAGCSLVARTGSAVGEFGDSRGENVAVVELGSTSIWTPEQPGAWEGKNFETRVEFHMPYMNFVEDIYIHADEKHGRMRLSYYSGANVFLINTTGWSYELEPIEERLSCLRTTDADHLEKVIPDLDTFRKNGTHRRIDLYAEDGRRSVGYEFTLTTPVSSKYEDVSNWSYYTPDASKGYLYAGTYTFIVNASAGGVPVSLDFKGHNVFFVQAHIDEYQLFYRAFYPRPEGIDKSFFFPPRGMSCLPFDNPTGPFMQKKPMRDFAMAMPGPRGDAHRTAVMNELGQHSQRSCQSAADCQSRRQVALRHFRWIHAANRRGRQYALGLNHMIDWTETERRVLLGRRVRPMALATESNDVCGHYPGPGGNWSNAADLPARVDWREAGIVGAPRDQGTCGSCWTFGLVGMLEGQVAKATGKLTRLSEQHFLDCSWSFGNLGCDGGLDAAAISWALSHNDGEVATANTYGTYLSEDGFCHFDKSKGLSGLMGVAAPPPGSQTKVTSVRFRTCWHLQGAYDPHPKLISPRAWMQSAIRRLGAALASEGPVSVSIKASDDDFYYYASGIYDSPSCSGHPVDLDHVVLLVGYGSSQSSREDYWLVRNSWSSHWGEGGYIRIAKKNNTCGIATQPLLAFLD